MMRRILLGLAGLACAAALVVGGIWLGDRLTAQSDEQSAPQLVAPVEVGGASGAYLEVGQGPSVAGLPAGASIMPLQTLLPPGVTTTTTVPSRTTTTTPGAAAPFVPVDRLDETAKAYGDTSLAGSPSVKRFVDLCAQGASGCPIGEPGTIVPFAGSVPPPTLHLRLWPGLTKALYPQLRCDPGYYGSTRLPVVLTADQPLSYGNIKSSLPKVGTLDNVDFGAVPNERNWYDARKASDPGTVFGTDLANGTQYCFSLRTERDPAVAAKLGTVPAGPSTYHIVATAHPTFAAVPASITATATIDYLAPPAGKRPPVLFQPLSGSVLQVSVPQTGTNRDETQVWMQGEKINCTQGPGADTTGVDWSLYPKAEPTPYDATQLAKPDYPYDRSYTAATTWNLVLPQSLPEVLCVHWTNAPAATAYGTWRIEAPNGLHVEFWIGRPQITDSGKSRLRGNQLLLTVPVEGCSPRLNIATFYQKVCDTRGYPLPSVTKFTMEHWDKKTNTYDNMGTQSLMTPTWCEAPTPSPSIGGSIIPNPVDLVGTYLCDHQQDAEEGTTITLYWRDQILCGGECSPEHTWAWVNVHIKWTSDAGFPVPKPRNPLEWTIDNLTPGEGTRSTGLGQ